MSEEELDEIRRRKMMEMQQRQAAQEQQEEAMMQQYEAQKQLLLRKILSPEARQRLTNIKMARPDFANAIESQLVQLAQSGQINRLGIQLPMSDEDLKTILVQISSKQKRDFNIKRM